MCFILNTVCDICISTISTKVMICMDGNPTRLCMSQEDSGKAMTTINKNGNEVLLLDTLMRAETVSGKCGLCKPPMSVEPMNMSLSWMSPTES